MTIDDCQFPLLLIESDGTVQTVDDRDVLECCDERLVRDGFHKGALYIDSIGRNWAILSAVTAQIIRPRKFWRYAWVRVRLDAIEGRPLDLQGFKEQFFKAIDDAPHMWEAREDIEETKAWIESFPDIASVIGAIVALHKQTWETNNW